MKNRDIFFSIDEYSPRNRCCIAAAVLGAGALSAGANIFGSQSAASAQRDAAGQATANQMAMFNMARGELSPYIQGGAQTIPGLQNFINPNSGSSPLNALMRLTTPGPDRNAALEATPGYQFQLNQGMKAVNNQLAARGLGGSPGAVAKGAGNFVTGLAQGNWMNNVNALLSVLSGGSNAMQNMVNTGAGSAASLLGGATATGGQIGSNIIGAGNATGAANIATGNAVGGFGNSLMLSQLLGNGGNSGGGIYGEGGGGGGF